MAVMHTMLRSLSASADARREGIRFLEEHKDKALLPEYIEDKVFVYSFSNLTVTLSLAASIRDETKGFISSDLFLLTKFAEEMLDSYTSWLDVFTSRIYADIEFLKKRIAEKEGAR
jgi:predicted GH43/DUF377 family glycosyl hydrolase